MATDKPRYPITVDERLLKKIENFQFTRHYSTRSQATVELIRLGLERIKEAGENPLLIEDEASKKEKKLLEMFWKLDEESQKEVFNFVDYKSSKTKTTPPR